MTEWEKITIGDIGYIITGKTPKTSNDLYYGGNIPFLTPSDDMSVKYVRKTKKYITEEGRKAVKNATLPANTICVSCIGSDLGKVVITTEETVTNQQINSIIVDNDKYDIDYIYYSMLELGKILNFHSKTSTAVPIVNKTNFSQYELICPPLDIQKKIGRVLASIDSKIELNNKINNNLEQQAMAIVKNYCNSIQSYNELKSLLSFANGFSFKSESYLDNGEYKIITIKNVQDGFIDSQGVSYIDKLPEQMKSDCLLNIGDVLISLTGNVGRIGIVYEDNLLLNQRVAKFIPKDIELMPFFYFYFRLPSTKITLKSISKGTAQQNLSPLETLKLKIPYNDKALFISKNLQPMFNRIIKNLKENKSLIELRNTLLPKLMSGELDISDLDI